MRVKACIVGLVLHIFLTVVSTCATSVLHVMHMFSPIAFFGPRGHALFLIKRLASETSRREVGCQSPEICVFRRLLLSLCDPQC